MEITIHGFCVLVDEEDAEKISHYKWQLNDSASNKIYFHVYTRNPDGTKTKIYLHRYLLNAEKGTVIDHINGNTLDCRKSNLRITDKIGNARNRCMGKNNTSGYKGVSWADNAKKWRVRIMHDQKYKHIGYFETKELAYKAYCEASKKYHGEFGRVK